MTFDYTAVGKRIRTLREQHNMSQRYLAEELHVTQGHISQVERGATISDALVELLATKFDVSKEYILTGASEAGAANRNGRLIAGATGAAGDYAYYNAEADDADLPDIEEFLKSAQHNDTRLTDQQSQNLAHSVELSKAGQEVYKLLEACKFRYTVTVPEIYDDDVIFGTHKLISPSVIYTFKMSCEITPTGFCWTADEIKRELHGELPPTSEPIQERLFRSLARKSGNEVKPSKTAKDTVEFVPYHFERYMPLDEPVQITMKGLPGEPVVDTKSTDIYRYRKAKRIAKYLCQEEPRTLDDPIVERLCPDEYDYLPDGRIDRAADFERFMGEIKRGVGGKSLVTDGTRATESTVSKNSVVFDGRDHSLAGIGEAKIVYANGSRHNLIVDDRRLTGEQFLALLDAYEGWTIKFSLESK